MKTPFKQSEAYAVVLRNLRSFDAFRSPLYKPISRHEHRCGKPVSLLLLLFRVIREQKKTRGRNLKREKAKAA